jgi:acyl-CoA thioester hydrolase
MRTMTSPAPDIKDRNCGPLAVGTTRIRVTYRDTDQMGVVYYSNYLVFFETGRTELLRELGGSYRELEARGIFLPVLEANCRYVAPAHYDDIIEVETRVTRWTRAAMDFAYACRRAESGETLATGTTRHAFMSREGRILRVGDSILPE